MSQYQIPTSKQRLEGATVQRTDPIPTVNQPNFRYYVPDINRYGIENTGPVNQLNGATNVQASIADGVKMEYPLTRQIPSVKLVPIHGATVQRTDPIPPVSQPQFRYYVPDINRYAIENTGPIPQLGGATIQRTDPIPTVNQPNYRYYVPDVNRSLDLVVKRLESTVVVTPQTYLFPLGQPDPRYYVRNTSAVVTRPLEGATVQQTYPLPILSQPTPRIDNYFRYMPAGLNPALIPSAVVPPGTIKKYYTGQFHTTKAILRRGIGF